MIDLLISAWEWFNSPIVEGHQAVIPLIGLGVGALMGAYQGKRKEDAARQKDAYMGEMASLDTAYSKQVAPQGYTATFTDRGAGMLGGGFQGALSGYQTGAGVQQGMNKQDVYGQMLEEMKAQKASGVAQGGMGASAYGGAQTGINNQSPFRSPYEQMLGGRGQRGLV